MTGSCSRAKARGFSLVEVMLASAFLLIAIAGVFSSLVFSRNIARLNTNAVMAKNIAQGYFEKMHGDGFATVIKANHPDIPYDADPPVYLDRSIDMRCRVEIKISGFGRATGGSANSLTDTSASWETNEWAGAILYLIDGPGQEQWSRIASNTATTLNVETAFTTAPTEAVGTTPATAYMINNGKTVRVTTRWRYRDQEYSQTLTALITNYRNDPNIGF